MTVYNCVQNVRFESDTRIHPKCSYPWTKYRYSSNGVKDDNLLLAPRGLRIFPRWVYGYAKGQQSIADLDVGLSGVYTGRSLRKSNVLDRRASDRVNVQAIVGTTVDATMKI